MWPFSNFSIKAWLITVGATFAVSFVLGWHAQTIWDGYWANKVATKEIVTAREGQVKIIKFNANFSKEKANAKDDLCVDKPLPDGMRLLISK